MRVSSPRWKTTAGVAGALAFGGRAVLSAHGATQALETSEIGGSWLVVAILFASAIVYGVGVLRLWRSAGTGRGVSRVAVLAFVGGWVATAIALVSPVDRISDTLFWVHMVQHELLMIVAAPLFAVAAPFVAFLWVWPAPTRRRLGTAVGARPVSRLWAAITAPAIVWLLHAAALWIWHLPSLYDAALAHEWVHALEHACFFWSAWLFWWGIAHGRYGRLGYGAAVLYVFATALHSSVLGALLTFSARAWYPAYADEAGGLTALEDQQLAGLVMWVPASLIFLAVGLGFLAAWLRESERRVRLVRSLGVLLVAVVVLSTAACDRGACADARALTGGDPARGMAAIRRYGCDTCHTIPGVNSAQGHVGPPLTGMASRAYVAGLLPNTPENLSRWIRTPREIEPRGAMPNLGVTDADARDIAAYLYTLR